MVFKKFFWPSVFACFTGLSLCCDFSISHSLLQTAYKKTITRTFLSVRVMPLLKQTQRIWRKLLFSSSADDRVCQPVPWSIVGAERHDVSAFNEVPVLIRPLTETCVVVCDLSFIYQQRVDVYTLIGGVSAYACKDVSNFQIVNIEAFILQVPADSESLKERRCRSGSFLLTAFFFFAKIIAISK